MTTTNTAQTDPHRDIALPPGAQSAGDWDEEDWRTVYGRRHEIGAIVAGAWASQQDDGSMTGNSDHDVYVDEMENGSQCERLNLSIVEARQLAEALIAAADTAQGWRR